MNVIARIDVPTRNDAVNLRDDVAITKIQFGLSEIAFGGFELGLGLLDGRSLGLEPSECAVDVALFFESLEHLLWGLIKGMDRHQAEPHFRIKSAWATRTEEKV